MQVEEVGPAFRTIEPLRRGYRLMTRRAVAPLDDRELCSAITTYERLTGALAELDSVGLAVARVTSIDMPFGRTASSAVAVDAGSLSPKELWTFDEKIIGMQVTVDGKRLYLGLRDHLAQLDVATGEIATIAPSGIGRIRRFGPALEQVSIGQFVCAC